MPATALTNLPCPVRLILAGPTTPMVLVMPLPHCADGSAKTKPELGPIVSSAFLYISVLIIEVRVS